MSNSCKLDIAFVLYLADVSYLGEMLTETVLQLVTK